MMRIKNIMQSCPEFKPSDTTEIIYQCTSFGKLYPKLINDFVNNIFGKRFDVTNLPLKNRVKFIFPLEKDVLESHLGKSVSCLKLREDFWLTQKDFPKFLFNKFEFIEAAKKYDKNVHHSKVMIIRDRNNKVDDSTAIYIGSHNMSGGAWGTLQKYGKTLYVGNYELGILFKPREGTKEIKQRIINSMLFNVDPTPYDLSVDMPYLFNKNEE